MALLTIYAISQAGVVPTYVAASAGGDTFPNDGQTFLHVKNGHTSPQTVTVNSTKQCDQGFDHDVVVAVPNASERMIGPFPIARFGRTVSISYTGVTALTIAAVDGA